MKQFTREELWELKDRIKHFYLGENISSDWTRLAEQLLIALDHLDAALARSEIK